MVEDKKILIRIPKELWIFLRRLSIDEETSVNKIVNICLEELKKKYKNNVDTK